ncbi:GNAT family N-acetyltransferase [Actinokineospora enzanensis]|uniref:GNAT family N-acetyltransferase n=1 Tax=Actinokineospora enzanensis TaxID=155975 RepID=UPI0003632FC1|nr:GNAT family N-acetyltransferase [Actinokineospora enzanensis]
MPDIRRATPDDWSDLRAVRLRALADAPYAFASNLAREQPLPDSHWRSWPTRHAVFLGWSADRAVGVAAGMPGDVAGLISVWAAPETRGTELATGLIAAVVEWARESGSSRVNAWVVENNPRAIRFYDRLGFTRTGETMAFPNDPTVTEYELTLAL